jgi:hypothetical protein
MFINGMNIATAIEYNAKPLLRPLIVTRRNKDIIDRLLVGKYKYITDSQFRNIASNVLVSSIELDYIHTQKLLAAHYDIFNLIGQGLALPIE